MRKIAYLPLISAWIRSRLTQIKKILVSVHHYRSSA